MSAAATYRGFHSPSPHSHSPEYGMDERDGICLPSLPHQQAYEKRNVETDRTGSLRPLNPPAPPVFTSSNWIPNRTTRRIPLNEKTTQLPQPSLHFMSSNMSTFNLPCTSDENKIVTGNEYSPERKNIQNGPGLVQYARDASQSYPRYKRRKVETSFELASNPNSESKAIPPIAGNAFQSWRPTGAHLRSPSAPVRSTGGYTPGQKHTRTHTTTVAFNTAPQSRPAAPSTTSSASARRHQVIAPINRRQETAPEMESFPSFPPKESTVSLTSRKQPTHAPGTLLHHRRNMVHQPPAPLKLFPTSPASSFTSHASSSYSNSSSPLSNSISYDSVSTPKSAAGASVSELYSPPFSTVRASFFLQPQKSIFEDDDDDSESQGAASDDGVGFVGMFKRSLELTKRKRKRSSTIESQKSLRAASIEGKGSRASWRWSKLMCGGKDNVVDSDED